MVTEIDTAQQAKETQRCKQRSYNKRHDAEQQTHTGSKYLSGVQQSRKKHSTQDNELQHGHYRQHKRQDNGAQRSLHAGQGHPKSSPEHNSKQSKGHKDHQGLTGKCCTSAY